MDTVAALIIFSSFGAWISVRARAAGPALVFGLFAALLFCTTPLGSWIPETLGSASHKVADVGGSLATVGADAPAPVKAHTVGGQR